MQGCNAFVARVMLGGVWKFEGGRGKLVHGSEEKVPEKCQMFFYSSGQVQSFIFSGIFPNRTDCEKTTLTYALVFKTKHSTTKRNPSTESFSDRISSTKGGKYFLEMRKTAR